MIISQMAPYSLCNALLLVKGSALTGNRVTFGAQNILMNQTVIDIIAPVHSGNQCGGGTDLHRPHPRN